MTAGPTELADGLSALPLSGVHPAGFRKSERWTLLVEDIDQLAPDVQELLLYFLDVTTTGEAEPMRSAVRVIATTTTELFGCVQAETFRSDLFYRLNLLHIVLPRIRTVGPRALSRQLDGVIDDAVHHREAGDAAASADELRRLMAFEQWDGSAELSDLFASIGGASPLDASGT